ncbi:hypothetical protein [Archangium lansingense]|uniref:FecR protein domain-containing protein n=1 Tax=Archangium lansingense TaxID=2995310 RepID=A0ABT4AIY8_9BACT|nr:hypothetical protein [Archangium lansinium]MCY1081658.1 hypothetical protein [Archangium lansinium]
MADHPELDPERLDLSAFEVPPPPPGLADRVLARLPATASAPSPRPSRRMALAAAAAVLLVALPSAWWVSRSLGRAGSGERTFTQRETVSLGSSALAVAEPGTELRWAVGRRGAVRVRQPAGRVFYRVDSGSDFQVDTPAGQVAVRGTCFTLEVQPMLPSKQSLTGAAVGAALTAAVFLTVHEGRVAVTSPAEASTSEVGPGERVELRTGAAPRVLATSTVDGSPTATNAAPGAEPSWRVRETAYVAELNTLRARVKELERSVPGGVRPTQELPEGTRKIVKWLDPSREELLEMAKECRLRWDEPGLRQKPPLPGPEDRAKLGMTEDEAEEIAEVYRTFVAQSLEQLRAIYVAATGDEDNARVLAPDALKQEILDKSPELAIKQAFHRVAQERAGLATPPANTTSLTPAERLVRFNTGLGDAYERALADKLGATRARELRQLRDGWGSRHDSSASCPGQ